MKLREPPPPRFGVTVKEKSVARSAVVLEGVVGGDAARSLRHRIAAQIPKFAQMIEMVALTDGGDRYIDVACQWLTDDGCRAAFPSGAFG